MCNRNKMCKTKAIIPNKCRKGDTISDIKCAHLWGKCTILDVTIYLPDYRKLCFKNAKNVLKTPNIDIWYIGKTCGFNPKGWHLHEIAQMQIFKNWMCVWSSDHIGFIKLYFMQQCGLTLVSHELQRLELQAYTHSEVIFQSLVFDSTADPKSTDMRPVVNVTSKWSSWKRFILWNDGIFSLDIIVMSYSLPYVG